MFSYNKNQMLSESFYALVLTTSSGVVLAVCAYALKSKCSHISCCGLTIDRNVQIEEDIELRSKPNNNNVANQ
jgi:hypothetical protein